MTRKKTLRLIFIVCLLGIVLFIYANKIVSTDSRLSPQSKKMIAASNQPTLYQVLKNHPNAWPPTYAVVLFMFQKTGLPLKVLHLILFLAVLIWIAKFTDKFTNNVNMVFPVLFYAIAAFNYINMRKFVSENIVILFSLITFSLMLKYLKERNISNLLLMAISASFMFSSRYFVLAWLFPILSYKILLFPETKFKDRFLHFVVFCFTSLYFISIWIFHIYLKTGHITGMNRTLKSKELTGFWTNIFFSLKTIYLDLFSINKGASHEAVNNPYQVPVLGYLGLALLFAALAASITFIVYRWRNRDEKSEARKKMFVIPFQSARFMVFEYFISYIIMTIVIWTIGHNDPLYTRFLYPSYVFLVLSFFIFYDWVIENSSSKKYKIIFLLFYGNLLIVNFYRTFKSILRF